MEGDCMFMGEYRHSIDPKGRLIIPSKFREELGESFIVTKGLDQCLFVYTEYEWNNFTSKLKTLPLGKKDARKFIRFFLAGALEAQLDKQGRILIPANLREYANISKEVITIGVSDRIEIWSKANWEQYYDDDDFDASELAESMQELGI